MGMESKKQVFPQDFFAIPHPLSPWASIQFRTKIKSGPIHNAEHWEEITLNPSSFFDNLTIEDNGGFQKIILNLHDKNFTKIETVITNCIVNTRMANKLQENKLPKKDSTGFFEFKIDNKTAINMRIRFGYSGPAENFIDDTVFDDKYKQRVKTNTSQTLGAGVPIIRSPWLYFQIMNATFNLTDYGFTAQLTAYSTATSFLDRAKMLKKHAIFRGVPKDIIITLNEVLKKVSNKSLELQIDEGNEPEPFQNEDGKNEIDINLGGSPDGGVSWRSLKSVLNELVSKIPSRMHTAKDIPIENQDSTSTDKETAKMSRTFPYAYYLEQKDVNGEIKSIIHFYYPDPIKSAGKQKDIRTYIWREHAQSIVKGLTLTSKTDFASLNRQLVIKDGTKIKIYAPVPGKTDNNNMGTREVMPQEVSQGLNTDYNISFVSDFINVENGNAEDKGTPQALIAQQVIHYMNQGVFDGAITLPGDPFYLFDTVLKPFQYMIKIIIMRPEYIDEKGGTVQETTSYLSGYYNVKTISHSISNSGFDTVLNIMRWPTI